MKNVSIVICAYNEKYTIQYVLKKCRKFNPDAEIIVVDDGSEDSTPEKIAEVKKTYGITLFTLPKNQGKSNAMAVGIENAKHEIILFFDADVTGIRKVHFKKLLQPLSGEEPEADMVLGAPLETLINYRFNPFRSLTGERSLFRKDVMPIIDKIKDIRFGVETFLNLFYQAHGKKVKYTTLEGLTHPTKYEKTSVAQATREYIAEGGQIADAMLTNYDLILKRIGNSLESSGNGIKESFRQIHEELNERIQQLLRNNG
ncbi:MAG: glycosyltransferase family 2 protein [Bacteroidota bacterium]|nr:glycosyltransferase family 2 protein [Bacteroidota bacterium]